MNTGKGQGSEGVLGPCLHCKRPLERVERIGRSVVGRPCGCRLYQGSGEDAPHVLALLREVQAAIEAKRTRQ